MAGGRVMDFEAGIEDVGEDGEDGFYFVTLLTQDKRVLTQLPIGHDVHIHIEEAGDG